MAKVCCVTHHYYPNHAHIRRDMDTLVEAGYDVDIICLRNKGQSSREEIDRVNVYRMPVQHKRQGILRYLAEYSAFFIFATLTLALLHLRKRYRVIEVNNMPDILVFTTLLPKLLGAKVILYVFDNVPEYFAFNHKLHVNHIAIRFLRFCERISCAYADCVIVTQSVAKQVLQSHGIQNSKMSVVLNVPNEGIFKPLATSDNTTRNQRFRLITHGSMIYNYGVQTIIRSIPLLVDQIPGLELKIVGEGEYLDKLISLAHELGVEDRVHFTGYVPHDEIPGMISQADVGIVAMLTDLMLPTKLFEYVAMTKPVVITDLPTMKAYFGEDCLTFYEPDNEHDLARCVIELYSQPSKAKSMALRAQELYEKYRWRNTKHDYLGVYDDLLR